MEFDSLKEKIIEQLRRIYDPEIAVNIYDLGLIYSIECEKNEQRIFCLITMTLTSAACPISENLYEQVKNIGFLIEDEGVIEIYPELVFDPPWTQDMMNDDAKLALGML